MLRQIVARIRLAGETVAESGAVVNVGGGVGAPWEADVAADVERVALVMIERAESGRGCHVVEATGDDAATLGDLVGVGEVKLDTMGNTRRAQRELPCLNHGLGNGEGKEDVGSSDVVVVEKIGDIGFEGIGVENPSAVRDGDAELMFLVALTVERQKAAAGWLTLGDQRTGDGFDWRRLIVVTVEGAECPMKARKGDGGAEARLDGGLGDGRLEGTGGKVAFGETRGAHAGGEHQPGKGFESVIDVEGFEIGGRALADGEG